MKPKKLPIGIQTLAKIRQDDCYYVDKTWLETGTPTFLIDLLTEQGFFAPDLERFEAKDNRTVAGLEWESLAG